MTRFIITGADARWDRLAALLEGRGAVLREDAPPDADARDAVILPYNASGEEILEVLARRREGDAVFIWRETPAAAEAATRAGVFLFSASQDRILTAQNALATAEGTLAEVLARRDRTLSGETVLVCGYGNCGSAIARLFWLCGCEVFVFARARGRREAEEDGFNTLPSLFCQQCAAFDLVINTIPAAIFPPSVLECFSEGCDLFQVASGDGGVDPEFCARRGISWHPLPGLPAKYSPQSEAEALAEWIADRLGEVAGWR